MSNLWGEFPALADNQSTLTVAEIEQLMKPQPLQVEGAILHQPSSRHCPQTTESYPVRHFDLDPVVLHTIHLLQYVRRLRETMHATLKQLDAFKANEGERPTFSLVPPIPDGPPALKRNSQPQSADYHLPNRTHLLAPPVGTTACRKLLRRSVATICAHAGFDTCGESVLETMTDVCNEYLLQMTKLLRRAVDDEALDATSGFQDVLERVLVEMGVGGRAALRDFYESRVTSYHRRALRQCEELRDEYERLISPADKGRGANGQKIIRQDELVSDIQFPRIDEVNEHVAEDSQMLHLEGLGLEVGISQDTNDEDSKWSSQGGSKTDMTDMSQTRPSESDSCHPASVDVREADDTSDIANTPSEAGDGESGCEIISPPSSIGSKICSKPPRKRRRR